MTGGAIVPLIGRPLRLGLIGGGGESMIGPVHHRAARRDGAFEIVAAAPSSDPERGLAEAARLGIARGYASGEALVAAEAGRDDGVDVVAVLTPDDTHVRFAATGLAAGIDVLCEKPLATDLAGALRLRDAAAESRRLLGLVHNYTGFPMVREARAAVAAGEIGRVQLVVASFLHGALGTRIEDDPARMPPRLRWRLDPARGGASHALADLGSHVHHLVTYVTGQPVVAVLADLGAAVAGRTAHDTATVSLRLGNGGRGSLVVSKAATGAEGGIRLEVYGETGGLRWSLADPGRLEVTRAGRPLEVRGPGLGPLHPLAARATDAGSGGAGAFLDAFANIYRDFGHRVAARMAGVAADPLTDGLPGLDEGVAGLRFIEACIASASAGAWRDCAVSP